MLFDFSDGHAHTQDHYASTAPNPSPSLDSGLSLRERAQVLGMPKSTVGDALRAARVAGVDCSVAQSLLDEELETRVYRLPGRHACQQLEPGYALIHQELKRPGVTLQLLWEEYARGNELAYRYTVGPAVRW